MNPIELERLNDMQLQYEIKRSVNENARVIIHLYAKRHKSHVLLCKY
jgi:hypothetical protein